VGLFHTNADFILFVWRMHCGLVEPEDLGFFFFSSRRRHTRFSRDWSSDVCSSDLRHLWYRCRNLRGGNPDVKRTMFILTLVGLLLVSLPAAASKCKPKKCTTTTTTELTTTTTTDTTTTTTQPTTTTTEELRIGYMTYIYT